MTVLLEPFPPWLRDVNRFSSRETQVPRFVPPADVLVTDDGATVHMDVPGVPVDALALEVENDVLTVRGERPFPYAENAGAVRRVERGFGAFERSLRVPSGLDPDAIDASVTNGVLTLQIPKPETLKPHRIPVQAGTQDGAQDRQSESSTSA